MRKFSKKIAMLMVLAMLVSMFSGIVSASAASVWFAKSVDDDHYAVMMGETIEVKKGEFINFDLFKADAEATEAGYEYTWESSDAEVLFINGAQGAKNGYARVKGEVGDKATITAIFKNLTTGKSAERSFDVVVVEELKADVVEEVEYAVEVNFGDEAFVVGEEYELEAVVYADDEAIEAEVAFLIGEEEIEDGVYAPAKAGEVTITVVVYVDGEAVATGDIECEVIEAVATEIVEVKQKDAKTVEIVFDAKITAEEAAKIELFQGSVAKNVYKKSVAVKDNVVTFTSYKDFADKTEWIFKYGESEAKLVASLGAVDYVVIDGPSTVYTEPVDAKDKVVDLKVSFYDANGVKVQPSGKDWIEWKFDGKLINVSGSIAAGYKISGVKADDVASLSGIYHSNEFKATDGGQYAEYKYDIAPVDVKILKSNAANIVAIAGAKVGTAADKLIDKLPANRYNYNLYVTFTMSDGKTAKAADFKKLSYESTDESKLIVNPTTGALIPLEANTSVEVIVNNDKDMIGVVTVVIGDKVKANDPSYPTYKTISNSSKLTANAEFKFEGKDNYGADASYKVDSIKTLSMPGTSAEADLKGLVEGNNKKVTANGNVITVNPRGLETGNYIFEAVVLSQVDGDSSKWTKTFSVFVEDAAGSYTVKSVVLVPEKAEYDTTITEKTEAKAITGSAITYKIIGYNDKGVAVEEIAVSECSITVKLNGTGDPITNLNLYQADKDGKIVVSGAAYKAIANGAYVFEGKYNDGSADGIKFAPVTVTVKGGQAAPAIAFDKNEVTLTKGNTSEAALKAAIIKENCFKAPDKTDNYEYTNLAIGTVRTSLEANSAEGTYVARVENVTVTQKFTASKIEVTFDVAVNKNITITVK